MGILRKLDKHGDVERLHGSTSAAARPMYWTSCYRLPGEDGEDVLVDSLAPRFAELALAEWERPPSMVLLTHHHEDHSGGGAPLARAGARILAPEGALPALADDWDRLPLYRHAIWGKPKPVRAEAAAERIRTPAETFRAVDCPGHSHEHVAYLHEEKGILFTGDAYFGRLRYARAVENVPLWIESLRALADLGAERAFPAHGPVVDDPREAFEATANWLEDLGAKARAMRSRGASVRTIRRDLLGQEGVQYWISGGDFSGTHLIRSLLTSEYRTSDSSP